MSLILFLIIAGINVDVFDTSNDDGSCNIVALASNAVVGSLEHLKSSEFPASPTKVLSKDKPNDAGGSIFVTWTKSVDDVEENELVKEYQVFRSSSLDGEFELIGTASKGFEKYVDGTTIDGTQYYYMVKAFDGVSYSQPARSEAVSSSAQWFHTGRINMLVATVIISFLILWFIRQAKSGKELYIRPIAGLEAVDDAVGRATEMGKPIMYIPGIADMDDIQTIASVIILGRVARKTAQYETTLLVPCCRSIVMSAAQETVKEAYFDAGRPDAFNADNINYLTDDQFGYAAGVDG
ncbi:MAG: hypothetical protein KAJ69_01440, partial [Thermoplasmatales archaeon]|nr:hypothetical protein [Thermoplasmatales archaeon]